MALNLRLGSTKWEYKVHPVVVFSILDHYKRRSDGLHRVIGTLLGEFDENTGICHIKNCFPVPHGEKEDQSVLVMEYHMNMLSLYQRVCKNEVVVGWYSTGDDLNYISSLFHDVYKSEVEEPVLVTVDVDVTKHDRMAVKGYVGKTVRVGRRATVARFQAVNLDIIAYEGEKIAVDALINGNPDADGGFDAPATILTDFENLDNSLGKLHTLLTIVADYCSQVKDGRTKGDQEIGIAISRAIAVVPHLDSESFNKMFSNKIQDLLMVLYLSNVIRTHISLADQINGLL